MNSYKFFIHKNRFVHMNENEFKKIKLAYNNPELREKLLAVIG